MQADALPSEPPGKPDERERYIQLNAEFQRIARRDDKVFFNKQCIKLEENNRRGMTRDLFRKIGNIKGAFHPKKGKIKDKNGRDLVDVEEIKKRWKEYTEELYLKNLNELNYYDGVVSHPEPDITECEVKLALGCIAGNHIASGCDEIPSELFKSLKEDATKVFHSLCQQIWKTQQWSQDWKILIPIPRKGSTKDCAKHQTVALISHASKVMLKILHARLQYYANQELPDVQTGFRKGRGTRNQISSQHSLYYRDSKGISGKYLFPSTTLKPLTVWIMTNCGKLLERWEYQIILPVF